MSNPHFSDLLSAYLVDDEISVADLPDGTVRVNAQLAHGALVEGSVHDGVATIVNVPRGTHVLQAHSRDGDLLGEEIFCVGRHPGEYPIMGFVTSFDDVSRSSVVRWLRALRCTVVQVYDWMESYSSPLALSDSYQDPLGRTLQRSALEELIAEIKEMGSIAQAYAPVCAADDALANDHPAWRLYRNDGQPQSLGSLLQIMDPGNREWQRHWINEYARAADALGFNGFHLDTYGYPRAAFDSQGEPVALSEAYGSFVRAVRDARPSDVVSFNQVNGVPRAFEAPASPSFRYVEVWPPNDQWRHLEGLLTRSAGSDVSRSDTLALYPTVWGSDRDQALRTAILSEAVTTTLGANTLIWGDDQGVLCRPYYVNHEQLRDHEADTVLAWRCFGLRCRDLFRTDADTSWYELSDENASVTVKASCESVPEPRGGTLFVRVFRHDGMVVVSLLDLSGSDEGSWSSPTRPGTLTEATVSVLVDSLVPWRADVATVGRENGRFAPLKYSVRPMREGNALTCVVPLVSGWSVLRMTVGPST